ncbi:hypothetical protein HanRHA438_Chr10g0471851 [Helianthus annuus]|nr:hypothetical protein HanRHA438_Chr10g0471851 [Helianthus annuus]
MITIQLEYLKCMNHVCINRFSEKTEKHKDGSTNKKRRRIVMYSNLSNLKTQVMCCACSIPYLFTYIYKYMCVRVHGGGGSRTYRQWEYNHSTRGFSTLFL